VFLVIVFSIVFAAVAGLIIKFCFDWYAKNHWNNGSITWVEFAVGMLIISLTITPVVGKIGWDLSKQSNLTFNEYRNGWELQAIANITTCTRDGSCRQTYNCDPYIVPVTYTYPCGNNQTCTGIRFETRYHSCPYVDKETDYLVKTTLGDYIIARSRLPDNPQANRWRSRIVIPQHIIDTAGIGAPKFWFDAKTRIDAKKSGPVTQRAEYDNYILASDRTILKQYSSAIEEYKKANLLPPVQSGVYNFYYADKVSFVGYKPENPLRWQTELNYLNAAFGAELRGDLHLVIVQNELINDNPDRYILAIKAYWQNRTIFGRNTISKNSVIIVVGTTDGITVEWARATTGMPLGNEETLVAIRNVKNIPLTSESVIGEIRGKLDFKLGIRSEHGAGVLEKIIWGLEEPQTKFKRVAMTGKTGAGSGFIYLSNEIDVTNQQKFLIIFVIFILSLGVWAAAAFAVNVSWRRFFSKK